MSFRTSLQKASVPVVIGFLVLAATAMVWSVMRAVDTSPKVPTAAFTTDDGRTVFYDTGSKQTPFLHDGKKAVVAHMFKVGDAQPYAGWLECYTDAAAAALQRTSAAKPGSPESFLTPAEQSAVADGRQYKFPGDKEWKPFHTMDLASIVRDVTDRGKAKGGKEPVSCDE